jgi:hypothetical protein
VTHFQCFSDFGIVDSDCRVWLVFRKDENVLTFAHWLLTGTKKMHFYIRSKARKFMYVCFLIFSILLFSHFSIHVSRHSLPLPNCSMADVAEFVCNFKTSNN